MKATEPGQAPRRSRTTFWLILLVAAAPVAASYFAYFLWRPASTVNYGELIVPRPVSGIALARPDGTPFDLSALRGKWVLVAVDAGSCDAECERKLVYLRQLRLTQGKNRDRVERAWLVSGAGPVAGVAARFPGMLVLRASGPGLAEAFPAPRAASDHIYLIDPLGNLMMRFPRDPDPKGMTRDLSRLLKASASG
ncbi:MAG: cytochrome c oxidase subunit I [Burkholderiales bacterium]|nr:cytochrome c oxidase subunit I [Burkholderiales bacterium]